jgi:hypothetical protein
MVWYRQCLHSNPSTIGITGCGANPSYGNGIVDQLYEIGHPSTYTRTCFRISGFSLWIFRKCSTNPAGLTALRHNSFMHINTLYSTFKWIK